MNLHALTDAVNAACQLLEAVQKDQTLPIEIRCAALTAEVGYKPLCEALLKHFMQEMARLGVNDDQH